MDPIPQLGQVNNGQDVHCTVCNDVLTINCGSTFLLTFKVNFEDWCEFSKKNRKDSLLEFRKMISTLYNEGGGFVFIHTDQRCLTIFNEQADDDLMEMIPDGSLFDERFRVRTVDPNHVSFQVLPPQPHTVLCVVDFHTTLSLNKGRYCPKYPHLRHLLTRPRLTPDAIPSLFRDTPLVKNQVVPFSETVSHQAKVVTDGDLGQTETFRGKRLLNLCWSRLSLPNFITAFNKQVCGGHYCLGLDEEKKGKSNRTGNFILHGVRLSLDDQESFMASLNDKLQNSMYGFATSEAHDINTYVECHFHPVQEPAEAEALGAEGGCEDLPEKQEAQLVHRDLFLVEVQVGYYPGVSFHDVGGPEAYKSKYRRNPAMGAIRVPGDECCRSLERLYPNQGR